MNKRQLTKWREDYTVWESPCLGQGLYLHVHFDEKDYVKRLGGLWNPDPSGRGGHWWMPRAKLQQDSPLDVDFLDGWSGTIQDWLNNYKMIAGQYGTLNPAACKDAIMGKKESKYELLSPEGGITTMEVYADLDIVRLESATSEVNWLNMRDSRTVWDMLIQGGSRKVIRQEETV